MHRITFSNRAASLKSKCCCGFKFKGLWLVLVISICMTIIIYQYADTTSLLMVKLSDTLTDTTPSILRRNTTKTNFTLVTDSHEPANSEQMASKSPQFTITDLPFACPSRNLTSLPGMCHKWPANLTANGTDKMDHLRCIMTFNKWGRLGNNMGEYATLITLSRWNRRPAYMLPEVVSTLQQYFQVTMPVLPETVHQCLEKNWTEYMIFDWMRDEYLDIGDPSKPLKLYGTPCSWTFFNHIREEIHREFRLQPHIRDRAQKSLRTLVGERNTTTTFIGVHARRTDYVGLMAGMHKGVLADAKFYVNATAYFRSRNPDAVFVVASDDMAWCRKNIDSSRGDVFFAGSGDVEDPIRDFALLTQCNHSIITVGTYGFWIAYLTGGEVVHLTNYLLPDSPFHEKLHFDAAYLPTWIPIDADLSQFPNYGNKST